MQIDFQKSISIRRGKVLDQAECTRDLMERQRSFFTVSLWLPVSMSQHLAVASLISNRACPRDRHGDRPREALSSLVICFHESTRADGGSH